MYDSGKIITGLIIFVAIFTAPLWYNALQGKAAMKKPDLVLPVKDNQTECVAAANLMRTNHMTMLNTWRNSVVRNAATNYVTENHKVYEMSLTKTCMKCHENKSQFCDQCHSYVGVNPYCFDCHNEHQNIAVK